MRLINLVDSVDKVNYGVWYAAIINAPQFSKHQVNVELWFPDHEMETFKNVVCVRLYSLSIDYLKLKMAERALDPAKDIIITHGSWRYPTRWGSYLKRNGFKWIYVPQGMLEPWSFLQKRWKKLIYYNLLERPKILRADIVRAVSIREEQNLLKLLKKGNVRFLPNGVQTEPVVKEYFVQGEKLRFLFLSRLHPKKNVIGLVNAWLGSTLNNNSKYELLIAGPDQGELKKLQLLISNSNNIYYYGIVHGEEKKKLMDSCIFFVLPSFSEGLPSSLLEAMSRGLIPIITEGCNLTEVFEEQLGIYITTDESSIMDGLQKATKWVNNNDISLLQIRNINHIKMNYSLEVITTAQYHLYKQLLTDKNLPVE